MVLPHSHDLRRRLKKSDCALGESERGGDSPLDQRRSSSPQCAEVCRFCTLHRRNRRISQVPRQLLAECAKTAQAHFLFRQMIAKSLRGRRVHDRIASGRSALTWTEERHRRCSTADWMSAGLRGASDVGVFYVVSSAAPSHVAGDTVARNRRGTPRRSIAHKRLGSRVRARTSNASCVARRVAENTRGRAARPDAKSAGRERRRQERRQCASGCGGAREASRRSRIVGQGTGAPRQPPIVQTRSLRSLPDRRGRALSRPTRQPSRLTFAPVVYTLRIV